ncbi:hypothetical protein [Roseateles sp. L2-2]|uniref:hypothetical protein n=1 Tax=Roseateles sp. L2-2 TaxID=3422597 RepID=UPI003D359C6F
MKDKRFVWGVIVTAIWLGVMVGLLFVANRPDKLNEWGDFCAGFFAPLAFMWLVLGYLQQGEELRQNTVALEQQLLELRQTVEVGRDQLAEVRMAAKREKAERIQALRPIFTLRPRSSILGAGGLEQQVALINDGGLARNVVIEAVGAVITSGERSARIPQHEDARLYINQQLDVPGLLRIHYEDAEGNEGEVECRFARVNSGLQFAAVKTVLTAADL